jgi:hypothetical protein
MSEDITPQFFTPDEAGDSQSVYKVISDNTEALQTSQLKARNRQFIATPSSTLPLDGIPGIPFERGSPNPDLFYQGEDIIYDLFLFHDGKPVSAQDYDVSVIIKTSPRAAKVIWAGSLDNGIYPTINDSGHYELWVPSAATEELYAGTYHLNVQIKERLGSGKGRFDRKYVLLQSYFNIDYSTFSPSPETAANLPGKLTRAGVESTWPNTPNTVGQNRTLMDEVFYSTE